MKEIKKIKIFKSHDSEAIEKEVNDFIEGFKSARPDANDIEIIPMIVGGLVLVPSESGLVSVGPPDGPGAMSVTIQPKLAYVVAVTWREHAQ